MMKNAKTVFVIGLTALYILSGCGSDDSPDEIPTYSVTGTVIDFATGEAPSSQASVTADGLLPAPEITSSGNEFEIRNVPLHSVFHVLASAPPNYRATFNPAVEVTESNVDDVQVFVAAESYLKGLEAAFDANPDSGTSVLIGRLVDPDGAPVSGVPATAFDLDAGILGPFFLGSDRTAASQLTSSSDSGYFVLFNVPEGVAQVTSKDDQYRMSMVDSPVASTAVTMADVVVGGDAPPVLPGTVSFANDVSPVFLSRGCDRCHNGSGIGKDLGGLHLNGAPEKMYKELTQEVSVRHKTLRVNLQNPEQSLLLTMPSREDPPDVHPNITFVSNSDPDYLLILKWIEQGALLN